MTAQPVSSTQETRPALLAHRLAPWVFAVLVLLAVWGPRLELVRTRFVLLLVGVFLVSGVWRSREALVRGGYLWPAAALFALSLVVTGLPFTFVLNKAEPTAIAERLAFTLIGWGLLFWLPLPTPAERLAADPPDESDSRRVRWVPVLGVVVASLAIFATAHYLLVGRHLLIHDEALYLLQSRWLMLPDYSWRFDPELDPFFRLILTKVSDGRMYSQYPPGWGLILAAFSAVGLTWWTAVVLGAAAVFFTYLLGRRLHSHRAGLIAAALLGTQHWFIEWNAGYMSHAATTMLAAASGWLMVDGEARIGRARWVCWILAGAALGVLLTIRPLTAVTLGVSLIAWLALRRRLPARSLASLTAVLALGGLGPALGLMHYNARTTGHPLRFGYTAVNGELHALGIGTRGYQAFGPDAEPVVLPNDFTLTKANRHLVERVWDVAHGLVPLSLLLPVLLAGIAHRYRFRWLTVAAFLLMPAAYYFYFDSEIRFYTELFPYFYAGVATLLAFLWMRDGVLGRGLVIGALAANLVLAATWRAQVPGDPWGGGTWYLRFRASLADFETVEAAKARYGRIVVFVREPTAWNPTMARLFVFNRDGLDGDIVIARDLGAKNELLLRRLPSHTPLRLTWDGKEKHAATLEPLAKAP